MKSNLMNFNSGLAILINLVWIGMSFGAIVPSLSLMVFMLAINLVAAISIMKDMTKSDMEFLRDNKTLIQKISGYLSLFMFIVLIFGQLVFGWYLILYYIVAFGLTFLVNPDLFKS